MQLKIPSVRPVMSDVTLTVFVTVYVLAIGNLTFWSKGLEYFQDHPGALVSLAAGIIALHIAALLSISVKYAVKPIFIFAIMVTAISSYFVDTMGILITRDMIGNAAVTTTNEAKHLITWRFVAHVALYGVFPSAFVAWTRVIHLTFFSKLWQHLKLIIPMLLLAASVTLANYAGFSSTFREHRDLMASLNPIAPIVAVVKYAKRTYFSPPINVVAIGKDAFSEDIIEVAQSEEPPHVLVVVAGETARAQNFSLYGYGRETNPVLKAHDNVFAFQNTRSCGTATAVSLPCMFSNYTRAEYSDTAGKSTENVIDVLGYADIKTAWWDANTGSKGIAARTVEINYAAGDDPRFCIEGECRDDILVDRLKQELRNVAENTVFVLHMIGSHGPAYYMRYQEDSAPFKPDCRTAAFSDCSQEQLINSYDNTIAYTDKILGEVIDALDDQDERITASMIYMSDHGESLGEAGLYLHGAPWFMAPDEQTYVPFLMWLSPIFISSERIDTGCLKTNANNGGFSHDNLFHTILGSIEVETEVYDQNLDVLAPCTGPEIEKVLVH